MTKFYSGRRLDAYKRWTIKSNHSQRKDKEWDEKEVCNDKNAPPVINFKRKSK